MNFKELENQFWQIKGKHSAGVLSDKEFRTEVAQLRLQDEDMQWWTLNPIDGKWLVYTDQQWVMGTPPEEKPKDEIPPPPPPPPSQPKTSDTSVKREEARPRPKRKPKPRTEPPVKEEVEVPPSSPPKREEVPIVPPAAPKREEVPKSKSASIPELIKCPKCLAEVGRSDKFCGVCGQILISKDQKIESRVYPDIPKERKNEVEKKPAETGKKAIVSSWLVGGLIYIIISFGLMMVGEDVYNKLLGGFGQYFADVIAAILIFSFVLRRNGIDVKVKASRSPGKDVVFLILFGLTFVIITQKIGGFILIYLAALFEGLFEGAMDDMGLIYLFFGFAYLFFVLTGIVLSRIAIPLARRMIVKSQKANS